MCNTTYIEGQDKKGYYNVEPRLLLSREIIGRDVFQKNCYYTVSILSLVCVYIGQEGLLQGRHLFSLDKTLVTLDSYCPFLPFSLEEICYLYLLHLVSVYAHLMLCVVRLI